MLSSIALTVITPSSQKTISVTSIEINTSFGNRMLLPHHAPLTLLLKPYSTVVLGYPNGETETLPISAGIIHIEKNNAQLLLEE